MSLIDTHFHLDHYRNHAYWYKYVNDMHQYTLCMTNTPELHYACTSLYQETSYVRFALGYNPQMVLETPFNEDLFRYQLKRAKYIGEVGVDFSSLYKEKACYQIDVFNTICKYARESNKLMSIHSKYAARIVYDILKSNNIHKAIIHWYTGDLKTMDDLLELGCYFSINANMCSTVNGCRIISRIPLDRVLVESDGPYTKVGNRRYSPDLLMAVYERVSEILEVEDLECLAKENFCTALNL